MTSLTDMLFRLQNPSNAFVGLPLENATFAGGPLTKDFEELCVEFREYTMAVRRRGVAVTVNDLYMSRNRLSKSSSPVLVERKTAGMLCFHRVKIFDLS